MKKYILLTLILSTLTGARAAETLDAETGKLVATALYQNPYFGSAAYREMIYEFARQYPDNNRLIFSPPPTSLEIANGLYGPTAFLFGGPAQNDAIQSLHQHIVDYTAPTMSLEQWNDFRKKGDSDIKNASDEISRVSQEIEVAKSLIGESIATAASQGGINLSGMVGQAAKFVPGFIVAHVPGLDPKVKELQQQEIEAYLAGIYATQFGNAKIKNMDEMLSLTSSEMGKSMAKYAAGQEDTEFFKRNLVKDFINTSINARPIFVISAVEKLKRIVQMQGEEIEALTKTLDERTEDGKMTKREHAEMTLTAAYCESLLERGAQQLKGHAGEYFESRKADLQEARRQAQKFEPDFSGRSEAIRDLSDGRYYRTSDVANQKVILSRRTGEEIERDLEQMRSNGKQQRDRETFQRIATDIKIVSIAGETLVDILARTGTIGAQKANKIKSGLRAGTGLVTALTGVLFPNPLAVAEGLSSFVGGVFGLLSDEKDQPNFAEELMKALNDLNRNIQEQFRTVMQAQYELHAEIIESRQKVLKEIQSSSLVTQLGISSLDNLLASVAQGSIFGKCNSFRQTLDSMVLPRLSIAPLGAVYKPEEANKILTMTEFGDIPKLWSECFHDLSQAMANASWEKDASPLAYAHEPLENVGPGLANKVMQFTGFARNAQLLQAHIQKVLNRPIDDLFVQGLAHWSPNTETLLLKSTHLDNYKPPTLQSDLDFRSFLSVTQVHQFVTALHRLYSLSFFVSTEGKYIGLKEQLLPILNDSKEPRLNSGIYEGPGSSVHYHEILRLTKTLIQMSLAQQNLLSGDMLLPILDQAFSSSQAETTEILASNQWLAINFMSFYVYKHGILASDQTQPGKNAQIENYANAYRSSSPQPLFSWLARQSVFGPEEMDRGQVKILCWSESDIMKSVTDRSQMIRQLQDEIRIDRASGSIVDISGKENDILKLKAEVEKAQAQARNARENCGPNINHRGGYRWFATFPKGDFFVPLPLPGDIWHGGRLYASPSAMSLTSDLEQIDLELNDLDASRKMSVENFHGVEEYLYQQSIHYNEQTGTGK